MERKQTSPETTRWLRRPQASTSHRHVAPQNMADVMAETRQIRLHDTLPVMPSAPGHEVAGAGAGLRRCDDDR